MTVTASTIALKPRVPPLTLVRWLTFAVVTSLYLPLALAITHAIAADIAAGSFYGLGDYATFWKAGLLFRAHDLLTLYDRHRLDLWMQHRFGGQLADESWLYTPPMGLLAALVSLVPLRLGFWLWRAATLLAAALALRRAGLSWPVIIAGLAGPAEFYDLLLGQNGALTGGLLAASLLALPTRQGFAGILAGCLCIKPQIAVLLPLVLLRHHRALLACLATAAVLAAAATLLEGPTSWRLFLSLAQPNAGRILAIPFGQSFQLTGGTVFLMARSLGAGLRAAWVVQATCSLAAGLAAWRLWRRNTRVDPTARMAATVCLSILAMPYGFSYDYLAFSIAMAALAPGAGPRLLPVIAALWLWPGFTSLITLATGVVLLPLAALLGVAVALPRLKQPPQSSNPQPHVL